MDELDSIVESSGVQDEFQVIKVCSLLMYDVIKSFEDEESLSDIDEHKAHLNTKYKSIAKKVKPVAQTFSTDCNEKIEQALLQPNL